MNSSSMQDRRVWIGGGLVAGLILVAAGWLLLISPERSSVADLRSQAATINSANQAQIKTIGGLAQKYRNIATLRSELSTALASLPPDSGLPAFTHEVTAIASGSGVKLGSITVGSVTAPDASAASTAAALAAAANAAASGSSTSTSTSTTANTSTTTTASSSTTASSAGSQLAISVTLSTTGPLANQLAFEKSLQDGARRVLVTSDQLNAAGSRTGSIDFGSTMTHPGLPVQCSDDHRPDRPAEAPARRLITKAASHRHDSSSRAPAPAR